MFNVLEFTKQKYESWYFLDNSHHASLLNLHGSDINSCCIDFANLLSAKMYLTMSYPCPPKSIRPKPGYKLIFMTLQALAS